MDKRVISLLRCNLCEQDVLSPRTRNHYLSLHPGVPLHQMSFRIVSYNVDVFLKCKMCAANVGFSRKEQTNHKSEFHQTSYYHDVFDESNWFIDVKMECQFCQKSMPKCDLEKHLNNVHPKGAQNSFQAAPHKNSTRPIEETRNEIPVPSTSAVISATTSKKPVEQTDQLVNELFVRCEYCNKEYLPEHLDDHVQREHVTDIEDNDEDDDDFESVSMCGSAVSESKPLPSTHVKCEFCSKRFRLEKIDKHVRRKHTDKSNTKRKEKNTKKRKRSVSTSSVEVSNGHTASSNANESKNEEEFYTIYVSKNELQNFLNQNRIYPKGGEFYLKDS